MTGSWTGPPRTDKGPAPLAPHTVELIPTAGIRYRGLSFKHLSNASNSTTHTALIDSGLVTTRAERAQGTPTQSHISPSILAYED